MPRLHRLAATAGCLAAAAAIAPAGAAAQSNGPSSVDELLEVVFELRHDTGAHRFARQVSDPASPRYRQYQSPSALIKAFGATTKAKRAAVRWADANGLDVTVGATGTFAYARATPEQVRGAFGGATARTAGAGVDATPDVPEELRGAVTAVSVSDGRPVVEPQAAQPRQAAPTVPPASRLDRTGTPAGCPEGVATGGFTPNQYLQAYGHADLHEGGLTGKGVRVGVVEIDGYSRTDVDTFTACFGIKTPPINRRTVGIDGPLPPGVETPLDLQVLSAAAPGVDAIDVYEGGSSTLGILLSFLDATMRGEKTRADVVSISLGGCETNDSLDTGAARTLNEAFAIAASAGISTFVSSGDQGSTPCTGINRVPIPAFSASFPASSQWVTAVGGTNVALDAENRITREIVWNESADGAWAAGGGGFSAMFGRPWYQRETKALAPSLDGGTTRIVPDIAALADNAPGYAYFCTGTECAEELGREGWQTVGGTSAAAPLMAAGAALANEAAARAGQPNVGFVNPLIYDLATSKRATRYVRDVTVGSNDVGVLMAPPVGTGTPLGCCDAAKGFDEVTGWGSLQVAAFSDAAVAAAKR